MKKLFLVLCLLVTTILVIRAQDIYVLNLPKSIEIAKEKSYNMLILQQNLKIAEYQLKAATNKFKTSVNLNLTAPNYVESIESWDTGGGISYYSNKKLIYSSTMEITQPLPTDGQIYISSGVYNVDDFNADTNSLRLNTRIGITQPIEAFYSYNNIKSEFKKANLNYELVKKSLLRAELDLVYNVSEAFYALISAKESKEIAKMDLDRQRNAYEIASNKYKAGLIRESEALQMEIDLGAAINSYDIASVSYESQMNNLKQELGLNLSDSISVVSNFDYNEIIVDVEKAVQLGIDNRLEIREKEINIELSDIEIKKRKAERFVQGDISAYYDFIGVGYDKFGSPAFEGAREDLKRRPGNRGISLNINIPILDWGVNKSLQRAAEANKESEKYSLELEKVDIEREIRNTVNQLQSSLNRLQLLERNVELAEKNFEISRARFSNGDIDAQTLALDRSRLNNAYNSKLDAYISYKLLIADLTRKTFYDFENDVEMTP